ncbi:hypothetical protein [Vagococcus xieshaowenii]
MTNNEMHDKLLTVLKNKDKKVLKKLLTKSTSHDKLMKLSQKTTTS